MDHGQEYDDDAYDDDAYDDEQLDHHWGGGGDEGELEDEDEDDDVGGILIGGNAENEKLDAEIKQKQNELLDLENDLEENTSRVISMEQHLANVKQEAAMTKAMADAKEKNVDSLSHQAQLATREETRNMQEVKKTKSVISQLDDQRNAKQNQVRCKPQPHA